MSVFCADEEVGNSREVAMVCSYRSSSASRANLTCAGSLSRQPSYDGGMTDEADDSLTAVIVC